MSASALLALARGMGAYFDAQELDVRVLVGWTARNRRDNVGPSGAGRVILIPGAFDAAGGAPRPQRAGRIDRLAPQNQVNLAPELRALAWWHQAVTCSVWGVDVERPQDEMAQIAATEDLLEVTIQAIHNSVDPDTQTPVGFANVEEWGEAAWTLPPGETSYGRELLFGFTLLSPLRDAPISKAYPQASVTRGAAPFPQPTPVPA